jgi:hypothetical protein
MDNTEYIVEREIRAIDKNGNALQISVGLGAPYPRDDMDAWECPVKVEGLYENLASSTGMDSWQSLQLARNLVVQLLISFIEDGGKIFLFGDGEEVKLNELQEFF